MYHRTSNILKDTFGKFKIEVIWKFNVEIQEISKFGKFRESKALIESIEKFT